MPALQRIWRAPVVTPQAQATAPQGRAGLLPVLMTPRTGIVRKTHGHFAHPQEDLLTAKFDAS